MRKTATPWFTVLALGLMACGAEEAGELPHDRVTPEVAAPAAPAALDDNMLFNAGFEGGAQDDGCPVEWTCAAYRPSAAGSFSTDDNNAYRGGHSAHWEGTGAPGTVIKQGHPSAEGRAYEVSAWVRGEQLSAAPFLQVLFSSAAEELLSHESFSAEQGANGWTLITATSAAAPAGTARVQLNLSTDETGGQVWWDEATMVEVPPADGAPAPEEPPALEPADYEVIPAQGQTIHLSDGEVFENKLLDLTTGQNLSINTRNATGWTIRNVGIKGRKQTAGTLFGVSDSGGGTSVMENIYLADGSGWNGGQPSCPTTSGCTHGPVGIYVGPEHSGHLLLRHINVQGWPNNGIYASAPGSNANGQRGTVHIDASYGANNFVSTFRIAGGPGNTITGSVAFNDDRDYNGRPLWVWKPGLMVLSGLHIDEGEYSGALHAGSWSGPTQVRLEDSQVRGTLLEREGSTITTVNVGDEPVLAPPAGVPLSAEEAAGGHAGD